MGAGSGAGREAARHTLIGAAVLRRGGEVLLVRQQGRDDAAPTWSLPGGRAEAGELPVEAMTREVREETGVEVLDSGRVLYVVAFADPASGASGTTFVFEVARWRLDGEPRPRLPHPGDSILEARFFPTAEAVALLERLPWRMMREPAVAHLRGALGAGALWQYRQQDGGPSLLGAVPETGSLG
jgi:ADP-ribose pyrophosphatase YjhB (NUDIX family)